MTRQSALLDAIESPELDDLLVAISGDDQAAHIGRKNQRCHAIGAGFKASNKRPIGTSPEFYVSVQTPASSGQESSVGRKGDHAGLICVSRQNVEQQTVRCAPDADGVVLTDGSHQRFLGQKR